MKNIAFIINPISGTQNKKRLPKVITSLLDSTQWMPNIVFTEYAGHATELSKQFAQMGFDAVVAVGGDGTVNEVACGVRDSQTAMGVIPIGSGNGFARHLGIPLRIQGAIELINHSEPICVDYGMAEDKVFVTTCGTGFDAHIAYEFAQAGERGLKTYIEKILKEAFTYHAQTYRILLEDTGKEIEEKAFLITFANANQWGNNAKIAPKASMQDGKMDICIMSQHALLGSADLAIRLFTKTIDNSWFMDTLRSSQVTLLREQDGPFHLDGDPVKMPKDIRIRMIPDGLRVLVAKRY